MVEKIGASGFDTLEDPLAAQPGQPQFEPQSAADAVADSTAVVKRGAREADARFDRPHPPGVSAPPDNSASLAPYSS